MNTLSIFAKPKNTIYLASGFIGVMSLTACQTHPTPVTTQSYTPEQSQAMLTSAIKHTLFSGQDFIAEQQVTLINSPVPAQTEAQANGKTSPVQMKIDCQDTHDSTLIAQMKADNLDKYDQVKDLQDTPKYTPYKAIKIDYQNCIARADQQENEQREQREIKQKNQRNKVEDKVNKTNTFTSEDDINEVDYVKDVLDTSVPKQLSDSQVQNFNALVAKSGKFTYTGNYRPFAGRLALQVDAGFDNKNLKYHYRVPAVIDIKSQALYVKPDVIMPLTALYMDNQLGMSWQDKWYKFTPPTEKQLPSKLVAKSWLMAIKDSFLTLPASQFSQAQVDTLSSQLTAKIHDTTQTLASNAPIVHWQQSASEQAVFYQAVVNKFIARMDNELQTDSAFLALPEEQKASQLKKWQDYKQKLIDYANGLNGDTPTTANGKSKKSKLTGQDMYFVLGNSQIKQVFAQQNATMLDQPVAMATWVTFNPDEKNLAKAVQPSTLASLTSTLKDTPDSNVLDGVAEFKRIEGLDESRRLFGEDPDAVKAYKRYSEKAKEKAKEKAVNTEEKWEFKPVDDKDLPKKQRF